MRILLFALAVLCLCDTVTAQSTATVTQAGNGSEAFVEQMNGTHTATVTQTGNGHWASQQQTGVAMYGPAAITGTIEQVGTGHKATQIQIGGVSVFASVFQDGGTFGPNESFQAQTGRDLSSIVSQVGSLNLSTIIQSGSGHTAVVTQDGSGNTASITQSN